MIRKPRPRCEANISPISTPSIVSEKPTRTPVISSGITAGVSTVEAVCQGESRITRLVRISTGLMFFTALSVNRMIGITPWITPNATLADTPSPKINRISG